MSSSATVSRYSFIQEWKLKMKEYIRLHYSKEDISDKKLDEYLEKLVNKKIKDKSLILVNNYTNKVSRSTILQLIDIIKNNHLIIGGAGCLFLQHSQRRNILIEFIAYIKEGRSLAKKKRKKFDKGTPEWEEADREQLAFKLIINSLYGCLGYPGFIMFNIFLAEAITNEGRNIISSAINGVENFVGDSMWFENSSDLNNCLVNIHREFMNKTGGHLTPEALAMFEANMNLEELPEKTLTRWVSKCIFEISSEEVAHLKEIFTNMSKDELLMMYFKNNWLEFSKLHFMKAKNRELIERNKVPLMFCEDDSYGYGDTKEEKELSRKSILPILHENWGFFELFVLYDYPIFDRLRKALYIDKNRSLYTDTDSVFISLDEYMKYLSEEVFNDPSELGFTKDEMKFTTANVALSYINRMITRAMHTLCVSQNITEDYSPILAMKNEFYFSRIMFCDVKKRYISNALLQEGQLLGNGLGMAEIKGMDFKKAGTKPFVREFYTKMALEDIMYPDEIDPGAVFTKMMQMRADMIRSIKEGNMEYFKQATVKSPEHYKTPFSVQGYTAITLWNTLMPDKALELPTDVNIVPIVNLTYPKPVKSEVPNRVVARDPDTYPKIQKYKERYPSAYQKIYNAIYTNPNPLIRHMNLSSIAIPKNLDYELPNFITDLYDITGVINNVMTLGLPILKSIGIKTFQVSTNLEHMSNMISL